MESARRPALRRSRAHTHCTEREDFRDPLPQGARGGGVCSRWPRVAYADKAGRIGTGALACADRIHHQCVNRRARPFPRCPSPGPGTHSAGPPEPGPFGRARDFRCAGCSGWRVTGVSGGEGWRGARGLARHRIAHRALVCIVHSRQPQARACAQAAEGIARDLICVAGRWRRWDLGVTAGLAEGRRKRGVGARTGHAGISMHWSRSPWEGAC